MAETAPDATKTELTCTAESNAVKRVRSDTESDGKELKRVRVSGDANEQLKESGGYVTEDERRSVMTAVFSEEEDNAQMLTDVPHPYAWCNNPDAQQKCVCL